MLLCLAFTSLATWSDSETKVRVLVIFKILYLTTCKCFVIFNAVLFIIIVLF